MSEQISVSVVVPVYNAEKHLPRTLKCLEGQTLKSIEIIIVDDASSDRSQEVIENFSQQSNVNIVYLRQPENQGVHNTRLLGLQHAKGEWIGFVDADDTLQPDMYEKMLEAGNRQQVDIIVCGAYHVTENGKRLSTKVRFKKDEKVTSQVFQQFCQLKFGTGSLWNKLYRRDVIMPFKTLYFPWRQDINEDMLLNIGCFSKAKSILTINDILYNYTHNSDSVSSRLDSTSAFTKTFRAYALAVSSFTYFDESMLLNITDLYRAQIAKQTYQVDDLQTFFRYGESLTEATELVNNTYPVGLALLSVRREPMIRIKNAFKIILKRIFK